MLLPGVRICSISKGETSYSKTKQKTKQKPNNPKRTIWQCRLHICPKTPRPTRGLFNLVLIVLFSCFLCRVFLSRILGVNTVSNLSFYTPLLNIVQCSCRHAPKSEDVWEEKKPEGYRARTSLALFFQFDNGHDITQIPKHK